MRTMPPSRPASREGLLLWVMNQFSATFGEHAILKGGLVLRLLDSERLTNDADFVFVPYSSKKALAVEVEDALRELAVADVSVSTNSRMVRATVALDDVRIDVECHVAQSCPSEPTTTAAMARPQNVPAQVIRVMAPSVALAHKLAAWNERRLMRDLYDIYFFVARLNVPVDEETLQARLNQVASRRPELRKIKSMTVVQFAEQLRAACDGLNDKRLDAELKGLLPPTERAGLSRRICAAVYGLLERPPFSA